LRILRLRSEPVRNSNSPASLRSLLRGDYFQSGKILSQGFSETNLFVRK
jgi:hypothetical protein